MSLSNGYPDRAPAFDSAMKSLTLPLGLANPLWLAFGAAASAGATWWLMTRWTRPTHLEAVAIEAAPTITPEPAAVSEPLVIALAETPAAAAEAQVEESAAEVFAETPSPFAPEPVAESTLARAQDDLTRLVGVGPRTAAALAARGVTRFADLAAWTADEIVAFDAEMKLKGRSVRDAWLDQAKRLAAEA